MLCAQNGLANEPAALRWFARVAGVCVWLPSGLPEPGTVVAPCAPLTGMLHLGRYPAERPADGGTGSRPCSTASQPTWRRRGSRPPVRPT